MAPKCKFSTRNSILTGVFIYMHSNRPILSHRDFIKIALIQSHISLCMYGCAVFISYSSRVFGERTFTLVLVYSIHRCNFTFISHTNSGCYWFRPWCLLAWRENKICSLQNLWNKNARSHVFSRKQYNCTYMYKRMYTQKQWTNFTASVTWYCDNSMK